MRKIRPAMGPWSGSGVLGSGSGAAGAPGAGAQSPKAASTSCCASLALKSPTRPRTALSGRCQEARNERMSATVMDWICRGAERE